MTWAADDGDLVVLTSHLTWLYDVVLREMIPEGDVEAQFVDKMCKVCQALDTHKGDARSLFSNNTKLSELLSDGSLYIYASRVVYADLPEFVECTLEPSCDAVDRHTALLQWLTSAHSFTCDVEEAAAAQELSQRTAFALPAHIALVDFLLREYCTSFVSVDDIHTHITSFAHNEACDEPLELALLCWLRKVASLFSDSEHLGDPAADLATSLRDGRLLAMTYYKYDTSFLPLDTLNLCPEMTEQEMVQNWSTVLNACRRSKVTPPFTAEQIVMLTGKLQWHLLWLVQMSYIVLKKSCDGILGGCPLQQYELGPGLMPSLPAQSPAGRYRYTDVTCSITRASATASIGINMTLDPGSPPLVQDVELGSAACKGGVKRGMVISSIDGIDIHNCLDLAKMITGKQQFVMGLAQSSVSFVRESMKLLLPGTPSSEEGSTDTDTESLTEESPETQFLLRSATEHCRVSQKSAEPCTLQDLSTDDIFDHRPLGCAVGGPVATSQQSASEHLPMLSTELKYKSVPQHEPESGAAAQLPCGGIPEATPSAATCSSPDITSCTQERVNVRRELMNELMQLEVEVGAIPVPTPARSEHPIAACSPEKMKLLAKGVTSSVRLSINRGRDTARVPGARPLSHSCERHLQAMQEENERVTDHFQLRTLKRFNSKKLNRVAALPSQREVEVPEAPLRRLAPVRSAPILKPIAEVEKKSVLPRCNRKQILNALKHVCLPGRINAKTQLEVLAALDAVPSGTHFVLLVKAELQPNFKALYKYAASTYEKVYGVGPRVLHPSVNCLRYDCSLKRFSHLPPSFQLCNPRVDAACLPLALVQAP